MPAILKKVIDSMDVKQNREDAYLKASDILGMGSDVLTQLVELGNSVEAKEADIQKRKKQLRTIIFILSVFIEKKAVSAKVLKNINAIDLLCNLSLQGFRSAETVLHKLGFFDSDILRERLLSLPIVDAQIHDKEISVGEALEEIKVSRSFAGPKGFTSNGYSLGIDKKRSYGLYRIDKKLFACRSKKVS